MGKTALDGGQKKMLVRICVALFAFVVIFIVDKTVSLEIPSWGKYYWLTAFGLYLAVYVAIGYDVRRRRGRAIVTGAGCP